MQALLKFCATSGRLVLVASLVVGLTSQTLANAIEPHIDVLIALLLFTACLRVGPRQLRGVGNDLQTSLWFTIALQILLPLSLAFAARLVGLDQPLVFAIVLLTSAPALSGSPHLVTLMGFDPAPALRQLVTGTALLPLTVLPVFTVLPEFGNVAAILWAALRLLLVIALAAAIAFAIRLTVAKELSRDRLMQIDGVSTILLAVVVVGLMAAIQQELKANPLNVLLVLLIASATNFGLQIFAAYGLSKSKLAGYTVPIGIIAGNRNIALFLTALPPEVTKPLLLFIACYQIPMYLTPLIMKPFYHGLTRHR